ncbi:MAG: hypothetical protein ACKO0M_16255 [Cyanobium sp.]
MTRNHRSRLLGLVLCSLAIAPSARAASPLLESVKQNPTLARQMCASFKQLNAQGESATSRASIAAVAAAQGLSPLDAEVLITYVIGLHCPDVR